jgi:hypothetical protein
MPSDYRNIALMLPQVWRALEMVGVTEMTLEYEKVLSLSTIFSR